MGEPSRAWWGIGFGAQLILAILPVWAQGPPPLPEMFGPLEATQELVHQRLVRLDSHTYRIGEITLDAASCQLSFSGQVNMATGLIEVVICSVGGKQHESVFVTPVKPLDLHIALLLLGLKDGSNPGWYVPEARPGQPHREPRPPGDRVDVFIQWSTPEGPREIRAEEALIDIRTGQSWPRTSWVFTGSFIDPRGNYVGDEVGSIVTNYHDRSAVIDCPSALGREDDYTYANERLLPKVGKEVMVYMRPAE